MISLFPFVVEAARVRCHRSKKGEYVHLGVSCPNVDSVQRPSQTNLVGILVGHHGTGYVFRQLRHHDGLVRLLRLNKTGY